MEAYLKAKLDGARKIARYEWYANGMVFVVKNGFVLTVTNPEKRGTQNAIRRAFRPKIDCETEGV